MPVPGRERLVEDVELPVARALEERQELGDERGRAEVLPVRLHGLEVCGGETGPAAEEFVDPVGARLRRGERVDGEGGALAERVVVGRQRVTAGRVHFDGELGGGRLLEVVAGDPAGERHDAGHLAPFRQGGDDEPPQAVVAVDDDDVVDERRDVVLEQRPLELLGGRGQGQARERAGGGGVVRQRPAHRRAERTVRGVAHSHLVGERFEQGAVRAGDDFVFARLLAAHGNGLHASLERLPAVRRAHAVCVHLFDVDVVVVDHAGGEAPREIARVSHHEVGHTREGRPEHVPAGRMEVDVEERVRDRVRLVGVHGEQGFAGRGQRARHGPVVAAAEARVGVDEADGPKVQFAERFCQAAHLVGVGFGEQRCVRAEALDPVARHDPPEEHLLRPVPRLEPAREAVPRGNVGARERPRCRRGPGELGRRGIEGSHVGVQPVEIRVDDPVARALRHADPGRRHVEGAMQQVLPDKALAQDFRSVAVRIEARQVDLPQALVALDVAHAPVGVGDRRGVDVRDAQVIVADLEGGVAVGDLDASIHGDVLAAGGVTGPRQRPRPCVTDRAERNPASPEALVGPEAALIFSGSGRAPPLPGLGDHFHLLRSQVLAYGKRWPEFHVGFVFQVERRPLG